MNEPVEEVRDFLRIRVTPDPNVAGRDNPGGEWIYTFFPRFNVTMDSFPIISITQIMPYCIIGIQGQSHNNEKNQGNKSPSKQ